MRAWVSYRQKAAERATERAAERAGGGAAAVPAAAAAPAPAAQDTRGPAQTGALAGEKVLKPADVVIPGRFRLRKPANWAVLAGLAVEFVQMAWYPLQVGA